jgi:hypothetical protein
MHLALLGMNEDERGWSEKQHINKHIISLAINLLGLTEIQCTTLSSRPSIYLAQVPPPLCRISAQFQVILQSYVLLILTTNIPEGFCGDQFCGPGESCQKCLLDCGPCSMILPYCTLLVINNEIGYSQCPGSPTCSLNGICSQGVCLCENSYSGPDCSMDSTSL